MHSTLLIAFQSNRVRNCMNNSNKELHLRIVSIIHSTTTTKESPKQSRNREPPSCKFLFSATSKSPLPNTKPTGYKACWKCMKIIKGQPLSKHNWEAGGVLKDKRSSQVQSLSIWLCHLLRNLQFQERQNFKTHSGLMVIDFDHLEKKTQLSWKERLLNDQYFDTEAAYLFRIGLMALKWIHQHCFVRKRGPSILVLGYRQLPTAKPYQVELDESG